jgi:hypothetical protein
VSTGVLEVAGLEGAFHETVSEKGEKDFQGYW